MCGFVRPLPSDWPFRMLKKIGILCGWAIRSPGGRSVPTRSIQTAHLQKVVYMTIVHDDVIKWKHFPRDWPFVRGIHRPPVNSPHKGQWRGALMFSLICAWMNAWTMASQITSLTIGEAGDLRRHRAHYDVIVMGVNIRYYFHAIHIYVRYENKNSDSLEWMIIPVIQ